MSGPIVTKAYMEVKGGMFPFVRNSYQSNHPVIYVKTIQKKRTDQLKKVTVYNMPEDANSVSMAFCFLYKQQNGFLVVKGNKVQIQLTTDVETAYTDKNCQFKWNAKSDKWGILKSVAEPQKYLRIVNNEFTVGTRNQGSSFRLNPE